MPARWIALAAAACFAILGAVYWIRRPQPEPPATYVDAKVCASCHRAKAESFRRTGMGHAFYRPSSFQLVDDYFHKPSEMHFRMLQRDGKYFQRRWQTSPDGAEINVEEKEIHYVMGSGNHVRTYLHRTARNTLEELPLAWYSEKGGTWAMNPGYDRPDHQGSQRKIAYDCMFCHNAYPQIPAANQEPGAEPVYSGELPEGIDCQRCHGPGSAHVKAAQKAADPRPFIVNPKRLSNERQLEVCMQCHLETTSFPLPNAFRRFERGPFSYKPGEPIADFMLFFDHAPGTGHDEKFEIVNSMYRLRKSQCFQKSPALHCTTCHDPHTVQTTTHYNDVCRQCHANVAVAAHPADPNCVGCHMPKRRTEDVVHAVMTDHKIQRRAPAGLLAEIPERHENDYRGEVVPYYPAKQDELYSAVVQVSEKSNLAAGIARLSALKPQGAEFLLALGDAYRNNGQPDLAIQAYREAVAKKPESRVALLKLGVASKSEEILTKATQVAPDDPNAWHELGLLRMEVADLERAVSLDPDMPEAHNSLGGAYWRKGDTTRAEAEFRAAIRIQPAYAEAHNNLANLLASGGNSTGAAYEFERAVHYKPDYAAAHFNYGGLLIQAKRFEDAQRQMEQAVRADPRLAEAHDVLGTLYARKGQLQPALSAYRRAVEIKPDFHRAHLDLAEALASSGDLNAAAEHLRQAAGSTDPEIRTAAADLLRQLAGAH